MGEIKAIPLLDVVSPALILSNTNITQYIGHKALTARGKQGKERKLISSKFSAALFKLVSNFEGVADRFALSVWLKVSQRPLRCQ